MIKIKRMNLKESAKTTWETVTQFRYYIQNEAALDYFTTHDNPEYIKKYKNGLNIVWSTKDKKFVFPNDLSHTFYPMYFHAGYDKTLEEAFPDRAWLSMFDANTGRIKKDAYGKIKSLIDNPQYKNLGYELLNIWRFEYDLKSVPFGKKVIDAPVSYQKSTEVEEDKLKDVKEQIEKICRQGIEDNPEIKELLADQIKYDSNFKVEIATIDENNIPTEFKLIVEVKNKETQEEYKKELDFDSKSFLDKVTELYIKSFDPQKQYKKYNYLEEAADTIREAVNKILLELYKYFTGVLPYLEDGLTLREKLARLLGVEEGAQIIGGIINGSCSSDDTHHCTIICMSPLQQVIGIGYNKSTDEAEVSINNKKYSINRDYSKIKELIKETSFKVAAIFKKYDPKKDNRGNGKLDISAWILDESGPMLKYFLNKYPQIVWDSDTKKYIWIGKDDPSCSVRFEYQQNLYNGDGFTWAHYFSIRYTYWPLD